MDVGVFTTEVGEGDFDRRDVAVFQPQALRSGMQRFTFVVDREPVQVGSTPTTSASTGSRTTTCERWASPAGVRHPAGASQ
jgi:hypothetical protein